MNPRCLSQRAPLRSQRGAALIFALMFLVMLSLIAVTATQVTTLEERMAGNTRDRDLAFEAAEAALSEIETRIRADEDDSAFRDQTLALNPALPNDRAYWNSYWTDAQITSATSTLTSGLIQISTSFAGRLTRQPVALVENRRDIVVDGNTSCDVGDVDVDENGLCDATRFSNRYRITVRAEGATAGSAVILQSEVICRGHAAMGSISCP